MKGKFLKKYKSGIHNWKKGDTANLHKNLAQKLFIEGVFDISAENFVPIEEDVHNRIFAEEIAEGTVEAKKPKTKD